MVIERKFNSGRKVSFLVLSVFLIIFLSGAFLRLHELGEESIWVDEAFSYHYFNLEWSEMINILEDKDVHPPLFYAMGYSWVRLFGNSEFSLRFLPSIFGTLAIFVFFLLGKELYGKKVSLLATLFFSFSYTMILYSQEAKMYIQLIFFFLLSLYTLIRFMKEPTVSRMAFFSLPEDE